jgi:hypothetical protein
MPEPLASVVIPAHDETVLVGDTLRSLLSGVAPGALEVVVVANGCTDDTATVARSVPGVLVLEIPEPSKSRALEVGDQATTVFPRIYLDADCAIPGRDALRLVAALEEAGVLAAAPARRLDMTGCSWWVRGHYRVWERLPQVRAGLFGRGVIALSEQAHARVAALPKVMSDDLAISDAFAPDERRVVGGAVVTIRAPRTLRDLMRRRVRVATGNRQTADLGLRRADSTTSLRTVIGLGLRVPALVPWLPLYLGTGLAARFMSRRSVRRGDYTTWLRDDSSRIRGISG